MCSSLKSADQAAFAEIINQLSVVVESIINRLVTETAGRFDDINV